MSRARWDAAEEAIVVEFVTAILGPMIDAGLLNPEDIPRFAAAFAASQPKGKR